MTATNFIPQILMMQTNSIPRTLRGVNGVRLINMPGVTYPKEVLLGSKSARRRYDTRPTWGISSREAAALLHCSESAARIALHNNRVRCRMVREPKSASCIYWDRKQVEKLAASRLPIHTSVPGNLVNSKTAADILGVGLSSLYRYSQKKRLHPIRLRLQTPAGLRIHAYYRREEVMRLKALQQALRSRQAEMKQILQDMQTEVSEETGGAL